MNIIKKLIEEEKNRLKEKERLDTLEQYAEFKLFGNDWSLNLKETYDKKWEIYLFDRVNGESFKERMEFNDYESAYKYYSECLGTASPEIVFTND